MQGSACVQSAGCTWWLCPGLANPLDREQICGFPGAGRQVVGRAETEGNGDLGDERCSWKLSVWN